MTRRSSKIREKRGFCFFFSVFPLFFSLLDRPQPRRRGLALLKTNHVEEESWKERERDKVKEMKEREKERKK